MSHFTIQVECPHCGNEEVEMDITMDSAGEQMTRDYPGSPPEWHADNAECAECHGIVPAGPIEESDKYNEEVQEKAADLQASRDEDYYEAD